MTENREEQSINLDLLRLFTGCRFNTFQALLRALKLPPYKSGNDKKKITKTLEQYCELKFHENCSKVTVVRVFV